MAVVISDEISGPNDIKITTLKKVLNRMKYNFVRWIMRSAECGVWKVRSVKNEECKKCGVWKMRSVENAECVLFILNSFVFSLLIIS